MAAAAGYPPAGLPHADYSMEVTMYYEGDNIEVSYEIGELWEWLILLTSAYYGVSAAIHAKEASDMLQMAKLEASAKPVPALASAKKFTERASGEIKAASGDATISASLLGLFTLK